MPKNSRNNPIGSGDFLLDPAHTDPSRIKEQRQKAQKLKKSQWWLDQQNVGLCHYCGEKFKPHELTMDHVIPLARGGVSNKENIVPACRKCNQEKKLGTPLDDAFELLKKERESRS